MTLVANDASVMTKITAAPMPAAVSTFLDTPKNGQIPKNWLNTTLFTRADPMAIINKSFICLYPLFFCVAAFGTAGSAVCIASALNL